MMGAGPCLEGALSRCSGAEAPKISGSGAAQGVSAEQRLVELCQACPPSSLLRYQEPDVMNDT